MSHGISIPPKVRFEYGMYKSELNQARLENPRSEAERRIAGAPNDFPRSFCWHRVWGGCAFCLQTRGVLGSPLVYPNGKARCRTNTGRLKGRRKVDGRDVLLRSNRCPHLAESERALSELRQYSNRNTGTGLAHSPAENVGDLRIAVD